MPQSRLSVYRISQKPHFVYPPKVKALGYPGIQDNSIPFIDDDPPERDRREPMGYPAIKKDAVFSGKPRNLDSIFRSYEDRQIMTIQPMGNSFINR
jgi:hypothetical protein